MSLGAGARIPRSPDLTGLAVTVAVVAAAAGLAVLTAVHVALAVLLVVGVALLVLGAYRPVWALSAFVVSVPLEYSVEYHANPSITLTKVAGAYAVASFALFALRTRRPLRLDRAHLLLLVLLCIALASTAYVGNGMSTTVRYVSWVLLFFLLTQLAGEPGVVRTLVWSLVASGSVAAVWGCINFLNGHTELATLLYGQQNDFAFTLAAIAFLALWLVRTEGVRGRVLAAVGVGCLLAGVLLSLSRGAWLSLAVASVFYMLFHHREAKVLLVVAALGAAALAGFVAVDPGRIAEGRAMKSNVAQENVDSRLTLWKGAVSLAADHPVLGIGPGNFGDHYYEITKAPVETPPLVVAHETYLEVAAELGVPGLVTFLLFLGLTFGRLRDAIARQAGRDRPGLDVAVYLRLSMVSICVGFLTLSEEFFAPVWLIAGLASLVWMERLSASSR